VIVYVDTSALVPLIISGPTSTAAERLWDAAGRVVATPLVYVEAHAALAQAQRLGRITLRQLRRGLTELALLNQQLDRIEVTHALVAFAGTIAERHALRAYDAVHLAGALTLSDPSVVFATGDQRLAAAASTAGLATADLNTR
jgi:uncharacterized protein